MGARCDSKLLRLADRRLTQQNAHLGLEYVRDVVVVLKGVLDREGTAHTPLRECSKPRTTLGEGVPCTVLQCLALSVDVVKSVDSDYSGARVELEGIIPQKLEEQAADRLRVAAGKVLQRTQSCGSSSRRRMRDRPCNDDTGRECVPKDWRLRQANETAFQPFSNEAVGAAEAPRSDA